MASRPQHQQDTYVVEDDWSRGMVRDLPRHAIPPGGAYNLLDFFVEKAGMLYKRGGWEVHSAQMGGSTSVTAVATIHIPTRVVAVGSNGTLYDVTSENSPQATSIGASPSPAENPPFDIPLQSLIFCYSDASAGPKKVFWNSGGSTIAISNLGGTPPHASRSEIFAGRLVLARGTTASTNLNRLWFSQYPNHETTWDTTNMFADVDVEIIGLKAASGVLLIFGVDRFQRILGTIPPGISGQTSDMELQTVAGVGCLDARSIVRRGNDVIFAGEEGVFLTNASGVQSLTDKPDRTGIQSYWRSLFPASTIRQITAGLLYQDHYICSILDENNGAVDTLMVHVPSGAWTRISNLSARMFATGRTEEEALELYRASADQGYVTRLRSMLAPTWDNRADGNNVPIEPLAELRKQGAGPQMKAYGHGHVTYWMPVDVFDEWTPGTLYAVNSFVFAGGRVWKDVSNADAYRAYDNGIDIDLSITDVYMEFEVNFTAGSTALMQDTDPIVIITPQATGVPQDQIGVYGTPIDNWQTLNSAGNSVPGHLEEGVWHSVFLKSGATAPAFTVDGVAATIPAGFNGLAGIWYLGLFAAGNFQTRNVKIGTTLHGTEVADDPGPHTYVAGTGATAPDWDSVTTVGDVIDDNGILWQNFGPQIQIEVQAGIDPEYQLITNAEKIFGTLEGPTRTRFTMNKDAQSVSLAFRQTGGSTQTKIYFSEHNVRPYPMEGDGE